MDIEQSTQPSACDEPAVSFSSEHRQQLRTLKQLQEENQRVYSQLAAAGAVPDPRTVLSIRLESVIEKLFHGVDRAHFDVIFETRMAALLALCQSQITRAQLLTPAQAGPPGDLIIPR